MSSHTDSQIQSKAFSIPSIIAVIAAALSFASGAVFGMLLAVVAII